MLTFHRFGIPAGMISWKVGCLIFVLSVLSLNLTMRFVGEHYVQHEAWYKNPAPCVTPKHIIDGMINLTFMVSEILTKLQVSHTLCYGTLVGALRYGRLLPWDNNVDFCVLKKEMAKVPDAALEEAFLSHNLSISYDTHYGEYIITNQLAKAVLTVFYVSRNGQAYREGLAHKLFYYFQRKTVDFPASLIDTPLHKLPFHGRLLPVPNRDAEILKYMYSDDWWTEQPPAGCKNALY